MNLCEVQANMTTVMMIKFDINEECQKRKRDLSSSEEETRLPRKKEEGNGDRLYRDIINLMRIIQVCTRVLC